MIQYLLFGILGISIIVIAIWISHEKAANLEHFNSVEISLEESVEQIQKSQQESVREVHDSLADGLRGIQDSVHKAIDEADQRINDIERAAHRSGEESKRLVGESSASLNRKIDLLATALEQISKENDNLRKNWSFLLRLERTPRISTKQKMLL